MPFPKPPFHTGHRTNESLSHETVRRFHRHNPPTPLEKNRINPPTPVFGSWREDIQNITIKKKGSVPWSKDDLQNVRHPTNKDARKVSEEFKKSILNPIYDGYKPSTKPPHFTMSPLRSHYRRTEYGARSSSETPEPLLRANEASKPWNITHHHRSKHPDEPEPGGLGLKSQRSSEPYHILHSKPLLNHPDFEKKVLMSTLSPRGGTNEYVFRHSPARRAMNIVTNGFTKKYAEDDAIAYEKKMWQFIQDREARRNERGKKFVSGMVWTKRTPTPSNVGLKCDNTPISALKSEGYAYNIIDPKKIIHGRRLDEFDCTANVGYRRVKKQLSRLERLHNDKLRNAELHIDRQYNRIARTKPQTDRHKLGYNLITNARKRGKSRQSMGFSPKAQPVWERLEKSDKNTSVVERFGAYGGLKNRLGKAEHCVIPPYEEKHVGDRIFPNQITRKETINEMFGSIKNPPAYKTQKPSVGLSKTTVKFGRKRGGSNIIRSTI
eukprot:g4039.t1